MSTAEQLAIARLVYALRAAVYALRGLCDALGAINRPRFEYRVLIKASRDVVWRLCTADHIVLGGPPVIETLCEPLSASDDLFATRVVVAGQQRAQIVSRVLERDEVKGVLISQVIPHALSSPPEGGRDLVGGMRVEATSHGTALTVFEKFTVRSFRDRIVYPLALRNWALLLKNRCEREPSPRGSRSAVQPDPQPSPRSSPAGVLPVRSIGPRAIGLILTMAIGIFGGVAGSAMLPTAYEREFDQDLSHYPLAALMARRDPALRKLLLRRTEAAYDKGGWPAAQAALDTALATEVMVYADDDHVLAMAHQTLRVLGRIESNPSDCKAYLLTGARRGDFPEARREIDEDIPVRHAAIWNGFERKNRGVTWAPLPDDVIKSDVRALFRQPVALSQAELQALDKEGDGEAAQYCSGSIKRLVNLLARPPSEAARTERQLIYLTGRDEWWKERDALCSRQADRPAGLACPQAISTASPNSR